MFVRFFNLYTEKLAKRLEKTDPLFCILLSCTHCENNGNLYNVLPTFFLYVQFSIAILLSNFTRYEKGLGGLRHKKSVPINHKPSCINVGFAQQKWGAEVLASSCCFKEILTHSFFLCGSLRYCVLYKCLYKCLYIRSGHQNVDGLTYTCLFLLNENLERQKRCLFNFDYFQLKQLKWGLFKEHYDVEMEFIYERFL